MSRRTTAMTLVLAAALSACAPQAPLEVNLRTVALTVPRIPTPAVEIVEPATPPPPISLPPALPVTTLVTPPPPPPPAPVETPPPPVEDVEDPCPEVNPLSVPERQATPYVEGLPAEDTRTDRATTNYADPATGEAATVDSQLDVTVTRLGSATSETTGQVVDDWLVERVDPATGATSAEQYRYVHESDSPLATDPGVWLVGLAWQDDVRGELVFEPAGSGVWLLPSPAVLQAEDGAQYVGTATDPQTLTTLAIVRNVTGRDRVDACGEYVEAFTVAITGTLTTPDAQRQVDWEISFAMAYGGVDVASTLALTSAADGFSWSRTMTTNEVPEVGQ